MQVKNHTCIFLLIGPWLLGSVIHMYAGRANYGNESISNDKLI